MKHLLLIVPMLHQGGFERVCVATARLMEKYYKVTILIFSDKDINYDISGLDVVNIDVPATRKFGKLGKVVNVFRRVSKVRKYKKTHNVDIAYSFGSSANYVNVLSKAGTKTKVLTGLRCSTDMENTREVSLFCNKADQVLSCSKEIMRELLREYDYEKSSYIYNPLDTEMIREKAKEEEALLNASDMFGNGKLVEDSAEHCVTLISVGRQDYIKGFWHLIKAFSMVLGKYPNTRLWIVGTGDFGGPRKLAEDLGVAEKVFFPGLQKNPFPFVNAADMYVLSSNHEGFPNAILEAMALGKPCVAADCKTGPREILLNEKEYGELIAAKPDGASTDRIIEGEFGIIVPDMNQNTDLDASNITEDDKMLAEGILKMLSDEEKMKHYGEKAYERALTYNPGKYAEDLFDILEKVQ
ncbi:glycosyltransferase [Butyrivibrio sp. XPD2002]|uniref:glycosyltransferase n=1 Tax=Butyrivibrio sp. XPD2002 TaxID=1280665 RepID=UPI000402237E|nr:glycosyltransferase [Butyrivibrio sp. XPD2002]